MKWWCSAGTWSHDDPPKGFDFYVFKTVTIEPRINPCKLVLEELPDKSYLNKIGVRNPGAVSFFDNIPKVPGIPVVSILGFSDYEWRVLAILAEAQGVPYLEMNVSCPNTEGHQLDRDSAALGHAIRQVRQEFSGTLGIKVSAGSSTLIPWMAEKKGVDYISAVNTLGTYFGGLSGNILRPFALKTIAEIRGLTQLPIIGGGGIVDSWPEQIGVHGRQFLDAGATNLSVGTGNILRGAVPEAASDR